MKSKKALFGVVVALLGVVLMTSSVFAAAGYTYYRANGWRSTILWEDCFPDSTGQFSHICTAGIDHQTEGYTEVEVTCSYGGGFYRVLDGYRVAFEDWIDYDGQPLRGWPGWDQDTWHNVCFDLDIY